MGCIDNFYTSGISISWLSSIWSNEMLHGSNSYIMFWSLNEVLVGADVGLGAVCL